MTPEAILRKRAFTRAIPSEKVANTGTNARYGSAESLDDPAYDTVRFELLTQSDFLREYDVNAHKINSLKYYPNPLAKDADGKFYAKVKSRVAVAYQRRIHTKRVTAITGNNANLRLIEGSQTQLEIFRKGWEKKNMENAIHDSISADGKVADVAVNVYLANGKMGWRVFSFENGDTIYPHYDPITGELSLFGRRYIASYETTTPKGIAKTESCEYLDVWDSTHYIRYRRPLNSIPSIDKTKNDPLNGWTVDVEPIEHKFPEIPIAYDRYGEPFWANSQSNIEGQEMALSQLAENNMAYALRILYSFGEEMDMQSTIDGTPLRIDSPDPNARVGFLEPADASNSFGLQLKENNKNIYADSFTVETPEIKSGSDMSSLTVKMLFADAYLKALDDANHFQPFLDKLVRLFQYAYFVEIGRVSEWNSFVVKAELFPYIFQSETEVINGIVALKGIGALSRQSASEMAYQYGFGVVGENARIMQEGHDALVGKEPATKDTNVVAQSRNK